MADQNHNRIFGDTGTGPDKPSQAEGEDLVSPTGEDIDLDIAHDNETDNLTVNDEGKERGGRRSEWPDRPSSADDMKNPRTGPIG